MRRPVECVRPAFAPYGASSSPTWTRCEDWRRKGLTDMIKKKPPSIQETVNRLQASLLDTHELQAQKHALQELIQALQILWEDQEIERRQEKLQALQEILQALQELLEAQERMQQCLVRLKAFQPPLLPKL